MKHTIDGWLLALGESRDDLCPDGLGEWDGTDGGGTDDDPTLTLDEFVTVLRRHFESMADVEALIDDLGTVGRSVRRHGDPDVTDAWERIHARVLGRQS